MRAHTVILGAGATVATIPANLSPTHSIPQLGDKWVIKRKFYFSYDGSWFLAS